MPSFALDMATRVDQAESHGILKCSFLLGGTKSPSINEDFPELLYSRE